MGHPTTDHAALILPAELVVDGLVLGGGPAGLAAAITLAQLGQRVLLLTRPALLTQRIGESLAPAANAILQQLGVWEGFVGGGHLPCYGNKSCWGNSELGHYDFLHDPNGHGWHIDRALFEQQLAQRAAALAVQQTHTFAIHSATWANDQWQITLQPTAAPSSPSLICARCVIDATGRTSWFARRQGGQRISSDQQVALVAFLQPTTATLEDSTSLVEAVADGWWYSARLPDGRLATAFMTDPDLHRPQWLTSAEGWHQWLAHTRYTAQRVYAHGYSVVDSPYFVAAASGRLDRLWGAGWLAVGDAAITYDPLAAHGLTAALAGGRDGALAVTAQLAGERDALAAYAWRLESAYEQTTWMRQQYYRAETRWPASPYWQRRLILR